VTVRPALVIYDEDCGFCRWSADRLRVWDRHGALRFVPLGSREAADALGDVPPDERPTSWHLVEPDGRVESAGAAVAPLLRRLPGGSVPASLAAAAPATTERAYTFVARHRDALGRLLGRSACAVDPSAAGTRSSGSATPGQAPG
jgi:predicted DCC family thiol-disulfide oxidoreductase YuxK